MAQEGYVYDQGFAEERDRLAGIEALWDPGTQRLLAELGAGPGARVLEAGAGGGSVVEWLAGAVGDERPRARDRHRHPLRRGDVGGAVTVARSTWSPIRSRRMASTSSTPGYCSSIWPGAMRARKLIAALRPGAGS